MTAPLRDLKRALAWLDKSMCYSKEYVAWASPLIAYKGLKEQDRARLTKKVAGAVADQRMFSSLRGMVQAAIADRQREGGRDALADYAVCALDDSGGEPFHTSWPHTGPKVRLGTHVLCTDCLDLITSMGFVHPAVPTRVEDADAPS